MKILVVSNLYPPGVLGGYELACAQAAQGLARLCHEVLVLSSQPGIAPPKEPAPKEVMVERSLALAPVFDPAQVAGRPPVLLQTLEARSQWIDPHNSGALINAVERFQPDVAYLWNLVGIGGLGLVMTLQSLEVPWVWHLGDRVPFQLCSERGELVPQLARAFELFAHGRWIVMSQHLQGELEGLGIRLSGPVTRLPLWVDDEGVEARIPVGGQQPLRLAFAGQVAPHKGADLAVDAAIELQRQGVDVSLDLWGEVVDLPLPGRVAAAGMADRIIFHGPTPHRRVLEGIASCDLLLFPTWQREPYGMVAAEAAAVGTPPILSDCGVAEWLDDGVQALKVPRTVDGLVDAVKRVAAGEVDLEKMARQAADRARSDLSYAALISVVERELAEVARPYHVAPRRARRAYGMATIADRFVKDLVERRWM